MINYREELEYEYLRKAEFLSLELPGFARKFYKEHKESLSYKTQVDYMYRFKSFLEFINNDNKYCEDIKDLDEDVLMEIDNDTLSEFTTYLEIKRKSNNTINSYIRAVNKYLYFFGYELEKQKCKKQTVKNYKMSGNESEKMIDSVLNGTGFTSIQFTYNEKTKYRDALLIALITETGLKPTELLALDIDDIILSKGQIILSKDFSKVIELTSSTTTLLSDYLNERIEYGTPEEERALFVGSISKGRGKRLNIKSVQRRIKRYANGANLKNAKDITPSTLNKQIGC